MKRSTLVVRRPQVKAQGYKTVKLDLETWRRHHSRPPLGLFHCLYVIYDFCTRIVLLFFQLLLLHFQ